MSQLVSFNFLCDLITMGNIICIGNHMDSSTISRATDKVIARAIASAIYACYDCNYSQIVREST